ncbi:MAG: hypothetical protein JWM33_3496, partial [Caulobacteraceae bacterium]|nr:hypothetical protein [Caulobacteraceae bacterium]
MPGGSDRQEIGAFELEFAALQPRGPDLPLGDRAEVVGLPPGLQFLMAWPALPDASRMIEARKADIEVDAAEAELWAAKLRRPSDGVTSR